MKKNIIAICLATTSLLTLHAEEPSFKEIPINLEKIEITPDVKDSYGYFTYGCGFPAIFGLNVGQRNQTNHHGYEFGVGAVPLAFVYEIHAFASYLYYPIPKPESQFYFGLGMRSGFASSFENWKKGAFYASPGLILGKSYHNKTGGTRFFQVGLSPASWFKNELVFVPAINISHGYSF